MNRDFPFYISNLQDDKTTLKKLVNHMKPCYIFIPAISHSTI